MTKVSVVERHESMSGRYATVLVDGVRYFTGVERGKRARIAYKPRGENVGYHWRGFVNDNQGRCVWSGRVDKSCGVRRLLRFAGVVAVVEQDGEQES
jgi:hypothetical protein